MHQEEHQPQLTIVVATLLIAALLSPRRPRIQSFIDRRFYRSKYDAAKPLEAFSAQVRDEAKLDALSDDLVGGKGEDAARPGLAVVAPVKQWRGGHRG